MGFNSHLMSNKWYKEEHIVVSFQQLLGIKMNVGATCQNCAKKKYCNARPKLLPISIVF